jgi:HD-like signal output (HDOD) protein
MRSITSLEEYRYPDFMSSLASAHPVCETAIAGDSALRSACDAESLELPPLPEIAQRVARLAGGGFAATDDSDDSDASATELAQLVQRDVALAAQVMRVANSALYARGTPVVTLKQAIAWLGMLELRKIAYGFAVRGELFAAPQFRRELTALWRESITTALFNQELARSRRRNVESAYLAGLLHRVGFAVILWRLGRAARSGAPPAREAMPEFIAGFEAQVGTQLAGAWRLPTHVAACIRYWRRPSEAKADRFDALQLALARAIASHAESCAPGAELPPDVVAHARPWLDELGFYPGDLRELFAERAKILATAGSFM